MENGKAALQYVLVTPARNEEAFIERTLKSVVAQTHRPLKWVIVSDGSIDRTDAIVENYTAQHEWIELVRTPERKERHFAGKVFAFNVGFERVKELPYDAIGSLDADISFDKEYFQFLLQKLSDNDELGVVGTPFREGTKQYNYRFTSIEHVSGACQLFRRRCFEDIGGYLPLKTGGIDLAAIMTARMKGWQTRSFTEKTCEHHRKMGAAHHQGFRERIHRGRMDFLLGSHPLWELFRGIYQMKNRPYLVGGFLILFGYAWTMLGRSKRAMPKELIDFRRREQIRQLRRIFLSQDRINP